MSIELEQTSLIRVVSSFDVIANLVLNLGGSEHVFPSDVIFICCNQLGSEKCDYSDARCTEDFHFSIGIFMTTNGLAQHVR